MNITKPFKPYPKKPIVVYAYQLSTDTAVETLEGIMHGKAGDYMMKGIKGEFYICAKDIFEATYDWVEE